ncbi:MAG: 2Fe-2S iron-sulfur cluster binding domain-containing protein [Gammaproteobacteria bacterium]|nr:2Fe-2S iron-sulfur cluster binding domain-containing protein [Gammaproteobacteria bacterium]
MTYQAKIVPSGESFQIDAEESVLDAGLRQGIALAYGCRHGNCSTCKYFLEAGEVDHGGASIYSLTEAEREEGFALLCCARPLSDLVIATRGETDPRSLPLVTPSARVGTVAGVTQVTPSLWQLTLELDAPLKFYPGQFVELQAHDGGGWRSYSIASSPAHGSRLEFVMKHVASGMFSGALPTMTRGTSMALRGPFGMSYLRAGAAPVLLVATGAGIAPLLSILEDAMEREDPRRFELFYGARTAADLPLAAHMDSYATRLGDRFSYRPTLSRAAPEWAGRRGRVTSALQHEIADASHYDAYLCGAPHMCDIVGTLLEAKGIRDNQLFYDKFHPAS